MKVPDTIIKKLEENKEIIISLYGEEIYDKVILGELSPIQTKALASFPERPLPPTEQIG